MGYYQLRGDLIRMYRVSAGVFYFFFFFFSALSSKAFKYVNQHSLGECFPGFRVEVSKGQLTKSKGEK